MEYRGTFEDLKKIVCEAGYQIKKEQILENLSIKTQDIVSDSLMEQYLTGIRKREHFNFKVKKP